MANSTPPEKQAQDNRPRLRCPSCAFMTPLPAEMCPNCGADLRTGEKPMAEEESASSRRQKIITGAVALLIIIGLAVFIFGGSRGKPETTKQAAPVKSSDDVGEAVNIFHDLPDQNLGVKPGLILERGKGAAERMEEKNINMNDIFLSTEEDIKH